MGRDRGYGLAKHCFPVYVETKPGANPVKVCQYPMPLEANKGITTHIKRLLDLGGPQACAVSLENTLLACQEVSH